MSDNVRKLSKFDGINIEKMDSESGHILKALTENENFVHETEINKIEAYAAETGKPLKNYTILSAEQKAAMEHAIDDEIHIKVDFSFHGYLEFDREIVMVTTVNSITK